MKSVLTRAAPGLFALAAILAVPANARDARLTQRLYDPSAVVRVDGRMGVQATITFAEDEHIENVAVGDSASWQITPNKRANLLFVKPLAASARTNMTVVTDRHTYYFDLLASPRSAPLYALSFTYPEEPKKAGPSVPLPMTDAERQAMAGDAPVDPATLNFAWGKKGAPKLLPSRIYDDGTSTYAVWSVDAQLPAILVTNEKGDEGPVNFAVRGDTIVIDGVHRTIVLRAGKERAQLDYRGPDLASRRAARPAPAPATVATASPTIKLPSE